MSSTTGNRPHELEAITVGQGCGVDRVPVNRLAVAFDEEQAAGEPQGLHQRGDGRALGQGDVLAVGDDAHVCDVRPFISRRSRPTVALMETPTRFGAAFEDVLAAAQADAGWGFERLYRWLSPAVLSYVRGQGLADPEDVVGDVFLKAFHNIGAFRGTEDQFRSWVFTVAHHRIVDERRRTSRRPNTTAPLDAIDERSDAVDVEEVALGALEHDRLRAVIDRLVPDQRDVVLMRVLGDLSIEQTAAALGKTEGAIKQLQRRALISIREVLARNGVTL